MYVSMEKSMKDSSVAIHKSSRTKGKASHKIDPVQIDSYFSTHTMSDHDLSDGGDSISNKQLGKSQQSREEMEKKKLKKSRNASEQNKIDNNKAVTTNKFDVLSTVNEEGRSINQALVQEDINKDLVNKEQCNVHTDEDKKQDDDGHIQTEVSLDQKVDGANSGSTVIVTPLSEVDKSIVEQVDNGKAIGREVEAIEEDTSELIRSYIISPTNGNAELHSSAKQMGNRVEKVLESCNNTPDMAQMIHNAEGASNINIEVSVDKEFIDNGRDNTSMEDMSSKEEFVILSNEDFLNEKATIVEEVEISTSGDITRSPIEEALKTGCYRHSKGDYEVGQIPIMVDTLVMKENVNDMSVLKKYSPNKELHDLVSHDMNRLDNGSKEGALKKGNYPSSDMKLSEEEDLRQHLTDVCKQTDITSHESIKSSKKGEKLKMVEKFRLIKHG
ncbi:hypothetical protein K7X08_000989 [Anisodus acutangulus]|uniref:Uncharacterized protein n=1 Tax=Anisodus acutangulus TaxID=402998 RepID=A0A9Q1RMK8_9SOLA|nr:hypothetical protein K7X08_000989 [Anisodus acutangulus]